MTSIIRHFAWGVDQASEIRAPYLTDDEHTSKQADSLSNKLSKIQDLIQNPIFSLSDLPAYLDAIKNQDSVGIDDRLLLIEKVLVIMSRLEHSDISMKIQQRVITLLYNDLPHPPSGYLTALNNGVPSTLHPSEIVKYAFRSADGSNYNPLFPSLGKAGSPYARSVPATRSISKHALPDPGLVFDILLRRDKFVPHPDGISSLFFAFADLVIHSIFDTNHLDGITNKTSSYLDLSILYGNSEAQVNQVRRKDGTGRLWDDVFADNRLLLMPPASCALLVLLSRNHNYIAQKILDINENGTFVSPSSANAEERLKQDDELFHRARMVNCGFFIQIIFGDYVGAILGLVRDGCEWRLDPLMTIRESNHEVAPRGEGNAVSIEFNFLYRWHSTLSEKDTEWTEKLFNKMFNGKEPSKVSTDDFKKAAHEHLIPDPDVKKWTFGELIRENGRFKDADIARIIQNATTWRAGAFRARGTPEALRVIEILGIEQSRSWGTCSLNEFRKFLGLRPYKTFQEWNPEPDIHKAAAMLYKDIDNLELHVGLQAEQAKEPGPGAGLCPGYTISRAILADAVALTRGDRFLTTEFTPFNLTTWGYDDCQYDKKDGSYGGFLTKLLFRTLPDYYPTGSAYAHFPFLEPAHMKEKMCENLTLKGEVDKYTWTPPRWSTPTITVKTYAAVKQVLSEPHFMSAYDERLLNISKAGLADVPAIDADGLAKGRFNVESFIHHNHSGRPWPEYFKEKTLSLINGKSIDHAVHHFKYVDIVQDVINLLPIHWIAEEIIGLPLNNEDGWYEQDVYKQFADVGRYVFLNFDPAEDWHLRESSIATFLKVLEFAKDHIKQVKHVVSIQDLANYLGIESYHSHEFMKHACEACPDASVEELAAYIFAAVVPTSAHFSQAITHVVDFYIADDKQEERADIVRLASSLEQDKKAAERIMVYVREALRLNPPVSGVYRTAARDVMIGRTGLKVRTGERIFASLIDGNTDVSVFGPNPNVAEYNRPADKAGMFGLGEHGLLSSKFFESVVPTILGTILGLTNINRGPGDSGKLAKFHEDWHGSKRQSYLDAKGKVTPFPDSLVVEFQ